MEFRKTTFLKIYTAEDVIYGDKPLYKAIIHEAISLGLAGATVSKAIAGYSAQKRGIGRAINTFFSGTGNLPIIIEIVDDRENLEKLLPFLEKHAKHSFVTIEEITYLVTDYIREKEADRHNCADSNCKPNSQKLN